LSDRPENDAMPTPAGSERDTLAAATQEALRQLTANLLRVTRSAGAPEDVVLQTLTLMQCFSAYHDSFGAYPSGQDVAAALRLQEIPDQTEGSWEEWDRAVHEMVRGALQIAAAELLAQAPQARAGRRELFAGYRRIEKLHGSQLRRLLRR
jgi:hypothetical protein